MSYIFMSSFWLLSNHHQEWSITIELLNSWTNSILNRKCWSKGQVWYVFGIKKFWIIQFRVSNQDTLVADILTTPPLPFSFLSLRSNLLGYFSIITASKQFSFTIFFSEATIIIWTYLKTIAAILDFFKRLYLSWTESYIPEIQNISGLPPNLLPWSLLTPNWVGLV